ncbi:MAG: DegV family protein [Lachnospiraceae bacterium]|nr:DegV family protein [Lachnospiraceae bacterium]
MKKTLLFADSTCDLSEELIKKYGVNIVPLCIVLDDKSYYDMSEITPDEIYEWADKNKKTPKTAAATFEYLQDKVVPYLEEGNDIIFFGISEEMSTTCNVLRMVSEESQNGKMYVINSANLSTGIGLQVIKAAEMINKGIDAENIVAEIEILKPKVRSSFLVDTLTYLARGGRCSGATALLANTLKLHPCIEVIDGKMDVGKKYRGSISKALKHYVEDLKEDLLNADSSRVFITHSGIDEEIIENVKEQLVALDYFEEILITRAGGVISSHCGPGTLGVLFISK